MRSLTLKLTLAFLLVGLTGSVLVAVIIRQRTQSAFDQFILNRDQQALVDNLAQYYKAIGSWEGAAVNLQNMIEIQPRGLADGRDFRRDWIRFTLVDLNRVIVYSILPEQIGEQVSNYDLERAIPLQVSGETAGWLILAPIPRRFIPDSPEWLFLRNVNSASLISAFVASALAVLLGGLLAFTLTRSLHELTEATVEIARGKLGRQVKVRSKDELGELATSFNKMSLDLERATKARRQMTADIAHDLRSPLSVISGYAEALSDGKLPGTPETYDILYEETKHLGRLVEDLRILSLADAGELSLALQPVSPQLLLERVAVRHAVAAQQKGVSLQVHTGLGLPQVLVDVERMAQVFDNLVLNAFRHTSQGGEIVLYAEETGRNVKLQVWDSGSGISAEDLPHVFDRFYRGDKSRQQDGETGLGLAIAKSIVEAHDGKISAESKPDRGTTMTILLSAIDSQHLPNDPI